ncbi:hypothetical protein OHC33_000477 [Knufia fluminis]|uniref:Uncharacterized protein n=1 Tax=Knufia fluminis TaxID=191047 RepID=A0AAN8ELM5_9EURO|nr:hypothetical protein OHC33_000477 [Knufia fluminis]
MSYNPREWTAGRQTVEARQRRDCYGEPLQTPPPPYPEQRSSGSSAFSRNTTTFTSPEASLNGTPVTQDTVMSGNASQHTRPKPTVVTSSSRPGYDLRRATYTGNGGAQEYNPAKSYQHYQPQQGQARASIGALSFQASRSSQDGGNLPPPPPPRKSSPNVLIDAEAGPSITHLEYTRRSTSAGPTPTAGPSMPRATRTLSNGAFQESQDWAPGLTLPGPPTMPPPTSSRSRSATSHPDTSTDQSGTRSRPPRLNIRNSNLTPIPATPNSVASGASTRPMPFPLRIDTGMVSGRGKGPAIIPVVEGQEQESHHISQTGPSALARRSAVRGPAARALGPLQSRSKSQSGTSDGFDPPSTTLSNNPWASALEQARSPQEESLPESAVLPSIRTHALTAGSGGGRSHTPPATPSTQSQKPLTEHSRSIQQAKVLPTPPLSQKPLLSANSVTNPSHVDSTFGGPDDDFIKQSTQRHFDFLRREQAASSDLERLSLFMHFMQQESLIRKGRYITAFRSDDFDVQAARGMLFNGSKVRRASTRDAQLPHGESPAPASSGPMARPDGPWFKDYRPQLSPIASMEYDDLSSRGRAPSRWWESQTGSQTDDQGQGVPRTKRESKYMSLSKKLLQDMESGEMDPLPEDTAWAQYGQQYPNEKANPETPGLLEEGITSPPLTGNSQRRTPRSSQLDISRLITLPPSYPRHYPAVNNSHPDLAEYRTTVRMLSDLSDARSRQSRHKMSIEAMRHDRFARISEVRRTFRVNIQGQLAEGSISYAEAAEAEKLVKTEEHEIEKQGLQAEFDTLQDVVINPLHDQLNERIEHLSNSLESLQRELFNNAVNQDPDQPVQEGDDVPELLEQLTQLKWLFEARESLHQELFGLLSQRNDAYKAIVALPYHQTNNTDKVRDTEAFFEKDAATRHATFCAEALKRHESFLQFIEDNALRGIELQSSAFWDITPGLVDLLQKIPDDLGELDLHIPEGELQENPAYTEHPQQYLYLLLRHAERSSYQYIEGQVNLYCLLHEVKTSSLAAHYRASKAQQKMAGDQSIDLADTRLEDEGELTDELKNRAAMIEEQWREALGKHFQAHLQRVQQQLEDQGAWDDIAAEFQG